jgi:hypothetical protein
MFYLDVDQIPRVVAHDEAGVGLLDGPGRREAALGLGDGLSVTALPLCLGMRWQGRLCEVCPLSGNGQHKRITLSLSIVLMAGRAPKAPRRAYGGRWCV